MNRDEILDGAKAAINGDRDAIYGSALDNFTRIGGGWALILGVGEVTPEQVALMLDWVKTSRLVNSPDHADSWVDKAGYSALGGEIGTGLAKKVDRLVEARKAAGEFGTNSGHPDDDRPMNMPGPLGRQYVGGQGSTQGPVYAQTDSVVTTYWDAPVGGNQVSPLGEPAVEPRQFAGWLGREMLWSQVEEDGHLTFWTSPDADSGDEIPPGMARLRTTKRGRQGTG